MSKANHNETTTEIEALLNEHEYSRLVGRSMASVRRDRMLGIGCPYVKVGALVRYSPEDVREFIRRNRRGGDA
jgi:hypothetical protein